MRLDSWQQSARNLDICSTRINLEKSFLVFLLLLLLDFSLTFLTVEITQETLFFEFWLKEFMIWSRLSILVMISSSVGWDFMVWFEGVNLAGGGESVSNLWG